jgi:prepilin-type N-terminal cleavage/methylation domain-containing protein
MFTNKKLFIKKGYTLIELLLALGISAILVIMIFFVYIKVSNEKMVNAEITKINTIAAGVENLYAGQPSYKGINLESIIKAEIFPDNMLIKDGGEVFDVLNGLGGRVEVSESGDLKDNSFMISYFGVYGDSCFKLPLALDQTFEIINVGVYSIKNPAASGGVLDKTRLLDACRAADRDGYTYDIQFVR